MANEGDKRTLGLRLRRLRLQQGLTITAAATNAKVHHNTWRTWEQGRVAYRPWRSIEIASALGVPTKQLFTDASVLVELTLSDESKARVQNEGRQAAKAIAQSLVSQLEGLIYEESTRKPVNVRPGARAKQRRTRAQVLAGTRAARAAVEARRLSQAPGFTASDT
jgi:transcriptional regulator with XRE-family HTH domain